MSTVKCRPEDFQKMMRKMFEQYGDLAFDVAEAESKSVARQAVSELKQRSPRRTGGYAKGWSHKKLRQSVGGYSEVVYNRTNYQLTHLLEKSHPTNGKGKYPSRKDHTGMIAGIEDKYSALFYRGTFDKMWQKVK